MSRPTSYTSHRSSPPAARSLLLVTVTSGLLGGCDDGTGPSGRPSRIESLVTSELIAPAGELLPEPLRVRVTDGGGHGVAGVEVEFLAFANNGEMQAENPSGSDGEVRTTYGGRGIVVQTNSQGEAGAVWEMGYKAGPHLATVEVDGLSPLEITATARPASPARVELVSGHGQIGLVDQTLAEPLVARLRDRFGNRVPEAEVNWAVVSGAGTLSDVVSRSDTAGEAAIQVALGSEPGLHIIRASNGTLAPVEFVSHAVTSLARDDAGDTFSVGISGDVAIPEILGLGAAWEADGLQVSIMFGEPMAVSASGLPNRFGGLLDIDTDMDESTGLLSAVDINRPGGGSTGMGVDVYVDLFGNTRGDFVVVHEASRYLQPTTPTFYGPLVSFTIPASMVGDGPMRMALVVATYREATDIAPEDGSLLIGPRP